MVKGIAITIIILICFIPVTAFAADGVSSADLIEKAKEYDGRTITCTGEVIGDIMNQGDHTWINVSDGNNSAVGVWTETGSLSGVTLAGRYDIRGDTVKVTGVFHRACPDHGGDFDIHAVSVELVKPGYAVVHDTAAWKIALAAVLFIGACLCVFLAVRTRRRAA